MGVLRNCSKQQHAHACRPMKARGGVPTWPVAAPRLTPPAQVELLLPLEDIARGVTKVVHHSRRVLAEGGAVRLQQVELCVDVKPGQLEGTRFVFEG
jgi:hypothetical protein